MAPSSFLTHARRRIASLAGALAGSGHSRAAVVPSPELRYAPTTWCEGPSCSTRPSSNRMALAQPRDRRHVVETKKTVRPCCPTSCILFRHFLWKLEPPTASTSSTSRIRLQVRGDREREPHVHAARIALHRRVEKTVDLTECNDLVELAVDLGAPHAQDRAVEIDVLAAGQLRVEPGPHLEQAAGAAANLGAAAGRLGDAREDLEQGGFARAVAADDAHHLRASRRRRRP